MVAADLYQRSQAVAGARQSACVRSLRRQIYCSVESSGDGGAVKKEWVGGKPAYSIIVPTYNERLNVFLIFKHLLKADGLFFCWEA